jgi:hypothetical protein
MIIASLENDSISASYLDCLSNRYLEPQVGLKSANLTNAFDGQRQRGPVLEYAKHGVCQVLASPLQMASLLNRSRFRGLGLFLKLIARSPCFSWPITKLSET